MTDAEFTRQLLSAYRTEIFGQALYLTLARLCANKLRQHKWRQLAALESQTGRRLALALRGVALPAGRSMRVCGGAAGLVMALLPWRAAIWLLQAGARPALRALEQFAAQAAGRDPALLDYLLQHERAQLEFAAHELAGRPAQSIAAVAALLATPAPSCPAR